MNEHEEINTGGVELESAQAQPSLTALIEEDPVKVLISQIREELKRVFFGQEVVVDQVLATFLAGGHLLLEGKAGVRKNAFGCGSG